MKKQRLLWALGILVVLFSCIWFSGFPWWAARHLGFAGPGQGDLPYSFNFADGTYTNSSACIQSGLCGGGTNQPKHLFCWTQADVQEVNDWPLVRVGSITATTGSSYPLLASDRYTSGHWTIMGAYVLYSPNCYVRYFREGGP